ncbi:MAG: folate-binding protein [Alphaproteobacteria bacterium]|nr:folate-binding protein [Alphaproteobacteria bacterium]
MQGSKPSVCLLEERCLIKISGADAESFLQNIVTNDVAGLRPDQLVYSCLLTPQGRFLHDFFISRGQGGFFLECETSRREDLIRRLNIFKLRAKVTIEDEHGKFHVYAATERPEKIPAFQDPRLSELGYRFYLPAGQKYPNALPAEAYRDRRIGLGVPEGSIDMKPETDTIANVNLDYLHAVSWNKGCYVGQEITAMTENRGVVKKRIVLVSGHMLTAGDALSQNGHDVGEIRSINSLRTQGLAVLKLSVLDNPASPFTGGAGAVVSAQLPKWLKL